MISIVFLKVSMVEWSGGDSMVCLTCMEWPSLTEELVALAAAGQRCSIIYEGQNLILFVQSRVWPGQKMPGQVGGKYNWACGLRVSELLSIHIWYNLPCCRCGVSTMMNLCSTFRAHQYLARRGTLCKSATQEFQDTGEQWSSVSAVTFKYLG